MKTSMLLLICFFLSTVYSTFAATKDLQYQYEWYCKHPSDIFEHIPLLKALAQQCVSVTEIGVRDMNSTWGLLLGLAENSQQKRSYTGIDLKYPPGKKFKAAKNMARKNGIAFRFIQGNDMDIDIEPTDLLFIDSLHTYCHLTYELEKFSSKCNKYIALHDTDEPWGFMDEFLEYSGDKSEYPPEIDRYKTGLWQAVLDFLDRHPEWILHERRLNNHGFTVLKRVRIEG